METTNRAQHKLQQLNEAVSLLDDISFKLMWALDFSKYNSINEIIEPLLNAVENAKDETEELQENLEDTIRAYEEEKKIIDEELKEQFELEACLN